MGDDPYVTAVLLEARDDSVEARLRQCECGDSLKAHLERSKRSSALLTFKAPRNVYRDGTDGKSPSYIASEIRALLDCSPSMWIRLTRDESTLSPTMTPYRRHSPPIARMPQMMSTHGFARASGICEAVVPMSAGASSSIVRLTRLSRTLSGAGGGPLQNPSLRQLALM
jgi:hypothetical protein